MGRRKREEDEQNEEFRCSMSIYNLTSINMCTSGLNRSLLLACTKYECK